MVRFVNNNNNNNNQMYDVISPIEIKSKTKINYEDKRENFDVVLKNENKI